MGCSHAPIAESALFTDIRPGRTKGYGEQAELLGLGLVAPPKSVQIRDGQVQGVQLLRVDLPRLLVGGKRQLQLDFVARRTRGTDVQHITLRHQDLRGVLQPGALSVHECERLVASLLVVGKSLCANPDDVGILLCLGMFYGEAQDRPEALIAVPK
jgi:hypothetical protein